MTKIVWGQNNKPFDEGIDHGVLYTTHGAVGWNGLVAVRETDSSSTDTEQYIDGTRIVITQQLGDFGATLEAYTYPDEFVFDDGFSDVSSTDRFGLSYRTPHGDGHHIHVVYNALAKSQGMGLSTLTNQPTAEVFAWNISAAAAEVPGASPTAHLIIDTNLTPQVVPTVERWLYGTDTEDPRLPSPLELVNLFEMATILRVTYNADGSWTATGPDEFFDISEDGSFSITAPTANPLDPGYIEVRSY